MENSKQNSKEVISEEIAIKVISDYLLNFLDGEIDVKKDYPKTLNAVMYGRLNFSDDLIPKYNLLESINKGTEFEKKELVFKTRVKPTDTAHLAKGIDLKTDSVRYSLVLIAHIIGVATINELDSLSKKDYAFVQEFSPVFM